MSDRLTRHAAVIGIDAYGDGIAPLRSAVADARAVAEALEAQHGFGHGHLLLDGAADLAGIVRLLEEALPEEVTPDSSVLLYFAGHGVARGDGSEGPEGFVLPADAHPADESTWLSMLRVRKALARLPCRHLLVVLDCCFAGSFRWASSRSFVPVGRPLYDSQYARFVAGSAWQALTSASHQERALDVVPGAHNTRDGAGGASHSPFAAALLRGLAGAADSSRGSHEPDGVITVTELQQYLFEELVPAGSRSYQTPGLWPLKPENTGEFIFLVPGRQRKTRPDPPLDDANNPWLGLRAYGRRDAALFFGRERVVEEIVERLLDPARPSLLAVIGASGTGKSSVVRAGVLPRLEEPPEDLAAKIGSWAVARMPRLQGDPRAALEAALGRLAEATVAGCRKLLFVDQFEELYTQCAGGEVREGFLRRLRELMRGDDPLRVALTLRSDFEPRLAASPELAELLAAGRYLVPAMRTEEYGDVIEEPAKAKALYFEPAALVGELVDEVMAMPGGLPLLSFALSEIYRQAQLRRRATGALDRALTREDYAAAGGVVGALHRRADELYEAADAARRETVRRLFLRLVAQQGGRLARRRVEERELEYADDDEQARVRQVVEEYVQARLLVADEGYVEPAHDTLVLAWEKLLDWLAAAGSQELLRQLWGAASAWEAARRAKGEKEARGLLWNQDPRLPLVRDFYLGTGRRLSAHRRTRSVTERESRAQPDELNRLERKFAETSVARRRRRRNLGVGITAAVILALSGATWYALDRAAAATASAEAERTARQAEETARLRAEDRANFVVATDLLARDPTKAALVLLELTRPENTPEAIHRLAEALRYPFTLAELPGHSGPLRAVFSRDGSRILSLFDDGTARVWRADGGGEPATIRTRPQRVPPGLPPSGNLEAAFASDGSETGSRVVTGDYLTAAGRDRSLTTTWELSAAGEWKLAAAALTESAAAFGVVAKLAEAQRQRTEVDPALYRGHPIEDGVQAVRSPDGSRMVTAPFFGEERLWDARGTGEPVVLRSDGDPSPVVSAAFSPDGRRVLTVSSAGAARLWRADGRGEADVLRCGAMADHVVHARFLGAGRVLLVSSAGMARAWSPHGCAELGALREAGDASELAGVDVHPAGGRVLTVSRDGRARLWRLRGDDGTLVVERLLAGEGGALEILVAPDAPPGAVFSADGKWIITVLADGEAQLRSLDGPERTVSLERNGQRIAGAAVNPRSGAIAGFSVGDQTIRLWRPNGSLANVVHRPQPPLILAFSSDGSRFVIGRYDGAAEVWRADGGGRPIELLGHRGSWKPAPGEAYQGAVVDAAFSPDGSRVVTASKDGTARVWALSFNLLQARVRAATPLCLDAPFRETSLGESSAVARRRTVACKGCVPAFGTAAARSAPEEALAAYRRCLDAKGW